MLFMSKHNNAPISDFFNSVLIRAKRSTRKRSKWTRSSQSTAMVPNVLIGMVISNYVLRFSTQHFRHFEYAIRIRDGQVFQGRGKWNGDVHCAHPLDGC